VAALEAALSAERFAPFLLLGVTGSGKTEVYLRAIEACRRQGRQALVLVPEIALTPQTVARLGARFDRVAVLHSALGDAQRARAWRRIRAGEADVVIGPRSAVFAPVPRLGLVVVDEEHEPSFKQQNAPRYHARDLALVRAQRAGAVVVLGSATPSLESWHHAREGRYGLLRLPERVAGRTLPGVQIVDLGAPEERAGPGALFSRTLQTRLREALRAGHQAILFQNRRGFATSVACPRCGLVVRCEHCDVALTYHRSEARALCHLCGHERRLPPACPDCALPGLRMRGVGTQTVEQELERIAPGVRLARLDSDTMGGRDAYEEVLGRFARREIDVLVGTQMIAKGLDFPGVTLVGVVSADTALALPDFRAAERTFQLLAQVAGRAGRGDDDGRVVVQTRLPDHPAVEMAAAQDFERFAEHEIADRRAHGYPPFGRLLRVLVRGPKASEVSARARATRDLAVASAAPSVEVLGPAPPPVARVQGRWREQVLVKAPDHREVARVLEALRAAPRPRGRVEESYDVDPVGLA
jgi:primosomal protein N' (replication factor Y)